MFALCAPTIICGRIRRTSAVWRSTPRRGTTSATHYRTAGLSRSHELSGSGESGLRFPRADVSQNGRSRSESAIRTPANRRGSCFVIFMTSIVVALMVHLVPGDAASAIAGDDPTAEQIARDPGATGARPADPHAVLRLGWRRDPGRLPPLDREQPRRHRAHHRSACRQRSASRWLPSVVALVIGIGFGAIAGLRRGNAPIGWRRSRRASASPCRASGSACCW